ncbi:MAG: mechanosensitive ion channel [Lachnospiraceae bacterium]|nr:mechanosensitive ion channel [Lachnospiraceae bacterium]
MVEIWNTVAPVVWDFLLILLIIFIGRKAIAFAVNMVKRATEKAGVEAGVTTFLASFTKIGLYAILVVIIAGIFGIPTASFIAVLSSCGVAIGLALQGSLQNVAGGVLILLMKPFVVGDYISARGLEGTVDSIDICYTKLRTSDNRIVIMPNGTLSNSDLINVAKEPTRRVDFIVPVSYKDDIPGVKAMLAGLAETNENILQDRPVDVYISDFSASSISIGFRVWCKSELYWDVKIDLQEKIKAAMDANGYTIPYQQVDIVVKNEK